MGVVKGAISIKDNMTVVLRNIRQEQSAFRQDVEKTKKELQATWDKKRTAKLEAIPTTWTAGCALCTRQRISCLWPRWPPPISCTTPPTTTIWRPGCGGVLYGLLETFWRGHTHWTMMVLAAVLCIPLDAANEHFSWTLPLWVQAILGGLTITAGELAAGLVLNVWLGLGIWDYSGLWGNLWGQICPLYTGLWCLLAGPVIVGFDWLDHWLCGGERPRYTLL